jgi:hypothetical protein
MIGEMLNNRQANRLIMTCQTCQQVDVTIQTLIRIP